MNDSMLDTASIRTFEHSSIRAFEHSPEHFPEHCCAIITCPDGRLLLELRPVTAKYAPDRLACFGGKREDEDAEQCLRRELREELAWEPAVLGEHVDLWKADRYIARFFACVLPDEIIVRPYAGACAVRVPRACLGALPLTPWHAAVLTAWTAGNTLVDLATNHQPPSTNHRLP